MKIVKTESRNKMADEWLNHRMVCYVERAVFATIQNDDILRHFQELKTRKKKLASMLHKLLLFLLTFTCLFSY